MPKVDFYTLSQHTQEERLLFACRLTEKAFSLGHRVYLHVDSRQSAEQLDDLLWRFRPESFLPHGLAWAGDQAPPPILIAWSEKAEGKAELLINLSDDIPAFHGDFTRISEIVINDEADKTIRRQHWARYKALGFDRESHKL